MPGLDGRLQLFIRVSRDEQPWQNGARSLTGAGGLRTGCLPALLRLQLLRQVFTAIRWIDTGLASPPGDDHTQMPVASVPRLHEERLSAPGSSLCDVASSREHLAPPHQVPSRKPALQVCALTALHALRLEK